MNSSLALERVRSASHEELRSGGEPSDLQRRRFVALLDRFASSQGRSSTPWPGLVCFRTTQPTVPDQTVYTPSICVVGQGAKETTLGDRVYRYDPFHYLVTTAHIPVCATVVEAGREKPYLSMRLEFDASAIRELLVEMEAEPATSAAVDATSPLRVSRMDARFLDAVLRFLGAIGDPMDRKILAPSILREIVYLALLSDQGDLLRLAARRDSRSAGVDRALHYIHGHLEDRLDVPTIAREAGMSTSTLHHSFKAATTLTPIQYLKKMRLHRARQLMIDEGSLAAEAAFRVGYESPSQFSRDFKRLFGQPPRRYVEGRVDAVGA
jgi:AraC-like DNA-binding protein